MPFTNELNLLLAAALITSVAALLLGRSNRRVSHPQERGKSGFYPSVELTKEGTGFLLSLALVNDLNKEVWAEECTVQLSEFKGCPSVGYQATRTGVVSIREFVSAGKALRIDLCRTLYDVAGRPQDEYGFVIGGTVTSKIGGEWQSQSLRQRRIRMCGSHPIEVRGTLSR